MNHEPELAQATINGESDRTKGFATGKCDGESEVCPDCATLRGQAHFEEFLSFAGGIGAPAHVFGDSYI